MRLLLGSSLWAFAFLLLTDHVRCILNTQTESQDITLNPDLNCRWYGGSSAKLECNCPIGTEEFIIKERSIPPYDVHSINITNCGKLTFESNAISAMRNLRVFNLDRIRSIYLQPDSLYWIGFTRNTENLIDWDPSIPSIRITITNSRIDHIANNAIKGRINRIELIGNQIQHIAPFGISNLQQNIEILIDRTSFEVIEGQGFKKFTTDKLVIANSEFKTIPSRAFYDITVRNDFILDNITIFEILKPAGFIILDPYKFQVLNSHINTISGEGFKVTTRGGVLIRNNVFNQTGIGAFRAITLNKEDPNAFETIKFENNVFHQLSKDALRVDGTSFRSEFSNIQLSELCDCSNLERYFRNNENTLELSCLDDQGSWASVDQFKSYECGVLDTKSGAAYIIGGVCAIVLVLVLSGLVFYFRWSQRSKSYGNNTSGEKNGKLSMIVPDGRTYRETELHVIVERTDLLTTDL